MPEVFSKLRIERIGIYSIKGKIIEGFGFLVLQVERKGKLKKINKDETPQNNNAIQGKLTGGSK
ncbi:hypothetical protein [Sediminibacterium sp.]|uniref:hypothetical protein n=1 Tax=Sediminibacterium sp. TaxID=1917865 RepID=UPI002735070A|nr:hypothetical protein [Sediminibacterium sp.]MDP3567548.1 hypothetical protein [Sediminibacterium sp.]